MKKIIFVVLTLLPLLSIASPGETKLDKVDINLADGDSLSRGAKHYVTYCLGCHSVKHIRYIRMSEDFQISEEQLLKDIAPEGASIYDTMLTAMNAHDSKIGFGIQPPDLSLIARSRGADWLYTYLRGFYSDPDRALGVNNIVFKDVGMPNVFWQLQGQQKLVNLKLPGKTSAEKLVLDKPGKLSPQEFDNMVTDLVNFLVYAGEPIQLERQRLGKYVILFLLLFTFIAYLLKKNYWEDIH